MSRPPKQSPHFAPAIIEGADPEGNTMGSTGKRSPHALDRGGDPASSKREGIAAAETSPGSFGTGPLSTLSPAELAVALARRRQRSKRPVDGAADSSSRGAPGTSTHVDARTESQGARSEADEGATPTESTPLLDPEERAARGPSVIASSAAELAAAFPVQRVPAFPEALLHKRGQPLLSPEVIERIESQRWKEGPNLVRAPLEAGGMVVRSELYFLWVEGGEIVGWMPASELPHGGMRRGDWLLWWGGHFPLEAMHDRPTDAAGVHHEAPNLTGRDLERREEAGAELNHDLEHFVAVGSSLSAAMKQTESVHQQVLEIMVVAVESTLAGEAMGAGLGQVEGLPQLASTVESKLGRAMGKATSAAPKASEAMKGLAQFADEVPEIAKVKQTPGVINGMRRLFDLFEDLHVTKPLRNEYLGELRQRLARPDANPEELFKELRGTVEASPGKYLRKGLEVAGPDYLGQQGFGSLRRAASLKSCMLMVNRGFLERAKVFDESLPDDPAALLYNKHSQVMVDLIKSGKVHFDPKADLRPDAVLEGRPGVSSAWFFAGADADVSSPASLQAQLAVGAEYQRGYVIFEVPGEMAGPEGLGARRPTALDLTVSPEGRLNANTTEAFGRTEPNQPGQAPIREVVLAPVALSKTAIYMYAPGN